MKVFLLQDISKVGRRHEIKDVADGFGRNVLIPQGKVLLVDEKNRRRIQEILTSEKSVKEAGDHRAEELKAKLAGLTVTIKAKTNDKGHLFAAIKSSEIVQGLAEKGIVVSEGEISLTEPIRTIGQHEITWHSGQVSQKFSVEVVGS